VEGVTSPIAASSVLVRARPSIKLSNMRVLAGSPIAVAISDKSMSSPRGAGMLVLVRHNFFIA
jgi:hypothetical protein